MSGLLSGIWRNSDHTRLVQIYDGEAVGKPVEYENGKTLYSAGHELQAMMWMIERKDDVLIMSTTFISVLPKREAWIHVRKSREHGPGIYEITAKVTANERWME